MNERGLFAQPENQPLARRMRPERFEELVGQEHLFGPESGIRRLIEGDTFFSFLLYGPPGTGKTASAYLIADKKNAEVSVLNAVTAKVADVKRHIDRAESRLQYENRRTVLFIDEIHRFNKLQQDALLPAVEEGVVALIGVTTQNPGFYVNPALLSRCQRLEFTPLGAEAVERLLHNALHAQRGLGALGYHLDSEAVRLIITAASGDGRQALSLLEMAALSVTSGTVITVKHVQDCLQGQVHIQYDRDGDAHYDIVSAFIKSMRGSDPDATLYYLARMIEGGEDPRFIVRRILIAASEDVGLADSSALLIASAAARAVDQVGMPESRIILSHAALRVALAPKSNSACAGIDAALEDVRHNTRMAVPPHLRDAHFKDAAAQGRGIGYKYPHDFPGHFVRQQYLEESRQFYKPSETGREKHFAEWLSRLYAEEEAHHGV